MVHVQCLATLPPSQLAVHTHYLVSLPSESKVLVHLTAFLLILPEQSEVVIHTHCLVTLPPTLSRRGDWPDGFVTTFGIGRLRVRIPVRQLCPTLPAQSKVAIHARTLLILPQSHVVVYARCLVILPQSQVVVHARCLVILPQSQVVVHATLSS